jgi:hypothetical protein
MWFLVWLFAGVILGFFLASLCNIAAKTAERDIDCSDFKREIKNAV